ncbi:MAG: Fe-S cluster assembly scaffold protein NifU [Candidatus Omnitrophota bacterium]
MNAYSDKVMDHFTNPRNVGEMENPSGIGKVGSPVCGDLMELYIKVDEQEVITDVKFRTFGCGAAIASSSILTEMIKGMSIKDAEKLSNQEVVNALGGLPDRKIHCSVLAEEALSKAVQDYYDKKTEKRHKKLRARKK